MNVQKKLGYSWNIYFSKKGRQFWLNLVEVRLEKNQNECVKKEEIRIQLEYLLFQQKRRPFRLNLNERKLKKNSECVKKKIRNKVGIIYFFQKKGSQF